MIDVTITTNLTIQIIQIIELRIKINYWLTVSHSVGHNFWPGWLYWVPILGYRKAEIKISD